MDSRSPGATSLTLLERVKRQDAQAWRRLVDLYAPLIHRWCCQQGLTDEDAADVSQEVFRAVALAIPDFRRDRAGDTFRGWLRVITRNKIIDYFQRRAIEPQAIGGSDYRRMLSQLSFDEAAESFAVDEQHEVALLYRRAMDLVHTDFEERTWTAFYRTAVHEESANSVAVDLGMTPTAVRKAKSRVLLRLRAELCDPVDI